MKISRQYIPACEFRYDTLYQVASPLVGKILPITVAPHFPIRNVWASVVNNSNPGVRVIDLVATLNNEEVYRRRIYSKYVDALGNVDSNPAKAWGSNSENADVDVFQQIYFRVSSGVFAISPMRLNITCDTLYLDCLVATSGSTFDACLFCLSKNGM